jgi:hypothetical protein
MFLGSGCRRCRFGSDKMPDILREKFKMRAFVLIAGSLHNEKGREQGMEDLFRDIVSTQDPMAGSQVVQHGQGI